MATVKISELLAANATASQFVVADDGTTTSKVTIDSIVNLASGIKSAGGEIQCTDTNISVSGHYIPDTNSAYDLGSAEYKIRHLYLSSNSMFIGDNKLSTAADELVFTRADETAVKPCLVEEPAPAVSATPGKKGQISVSDDGEWLLVCVSDGVWKRVAVAAW
jgi:hypothetical protein